ncbi:MAG: ARMT1-like domain-containing protein [Methanomicrobiales archaeon]|nr:ARMT1-like domain-containing protein [Methanomicrobiales archaeon]
MQLDDRCVDCLLSRVALECRLSGARVAEEEEVVRSSRALLLAIRDDPIPHPALASIIHRHAYALLGDPDPFRALKEESNREAAVVCRKVRERLLTFRDLVLASIIGNTFDYGVRSHEVTGDFSSFFEREFAQGLTIDDTEMMRPLLSRVVYLTDNCGEVIFDRLLLEFLYKSGSDITLAVREAPILNDVTYREAEDLGLARFVNTITTIGGGAEIGMVMARIPNVLRRAIASCTLIIAKGMANYEALTEIPGLPPVAYLLAVKCDPIAEDVGVPRGSKVAILSTGAKR